MSIGDRVRNAIPKPALSQTSIIAATLVLAYIVFIVSRGEASKYYALLFTSNSANQNQNGVTIPIQ